MLALRATDYASGLRLPTSDVPTLDGSNQWSGSNFFDVIYTRLLYVTQYAEFRGPYNVISAASAAHWGTADGYPFRLMSNNVPRLQLLSGGPLLIASGAFPSAFSTITSQSNDAFDRADENPITGWTRVAGSTADFIVSASAAHVSGTGPDSVISFRGTAAWSTDANAQIDILSGYFDTAEGGLALRTLSATGAFTGILFFSRTASADVTPDGYYLYARPGGFTLSSADSNVSSAHTLRLELSGGVATGYVDNVFRISASTASSYPGMQGLYGNRGVGTTTHARGYDNFFASALSTSGYFPPVAEDLIFQRGSTLWLWDQALSLQQAIQFQANMLTFGSATGTTFSGPVSCIISAGTSAFFPTTSYGVTRIVSAVGTAGLSGVVALSAGSGLTISAVAGNVILLSAGPSMPASATFAVSAGVAVSALSATQWALSANYAASALAYAASAIWASAAASATWAATAGLARDFAFFIGH